MHRSRGVARRNCSSKDSCCLNSSSKPKTPQELQKNAIMERNILIGAAVGAVVCVVGKVKRQTDDEHRPGASNDYVWTAIGGTMAGGLFGMTWVPLPAISCIMATVVALDWLNAFPDIVKFVHFLRHGDTKKEQDEEEEDD